MKLDHRDPKTNMFTNGVAKGLDINGDGYIEDGNTFGGDKVRVVGEDIVLATGKFKGLKFKTFDTTHYDDFFLEIKGDKDLGNYGVTLDGWVIEILPSPSNERVKELTLLGALSTGTREKPDTGLLEESVNKAIQQKSRF